MELDVNEVNKKSDTALHMAVQSPSNPRPSNIVKRLLIKGSNLALENKEGCTPIDICEKLSTNSQALKDTLGVLKRSDNRSKGFC